MTVGFKSLLFSIFFFGIFSCKDLLDKSDPRKLLLENRSNLNTVFYLSNVFESSTIDFSDPYKRDQMKVVEIGQSLKYNSVAKWETVIDRYSQKELVVFVLNSDSVRKYANIIPPYPSNQDEVLKVWHLNLDSLTQNNWKITYP